MSQYALTDKQKNLLDELNSVISQEGIEIRHNEIPDFKPGESVSIDVEHDEQGAFVGVGMYRAADCRAYYYSDIHCLLRVPISSLSLIGHNGISDIECLQTWGVQVVYEQLVHDTMLVGHLLDSSLKDYGLKGMSKRELGIIYPSYDDIVGKRGLKTERITLDKQPMELVMKYNTMDVYTTFKLYEKQNKRVNI